MNSLYQLLGICQKARAISYGAKLIDSIRSKKVYLVLLTNTLGKSQTKKISQKCYYYNIKCLQLLDEFLLSKALNLNNIKAIGITNINLANKILETLILKSKEE